MDIDDTTYSDLSLFSQEEEFSIFHKLDLTRTSGGREKLLEYFNRPFGTLGPILETQQILSLLLMRMDEWPLTISNGTVMVMERFYETAIDTMPQSHNLPGALAYKLFHAPDYSLVRYSIGHFADFVRGMTRLMELLYQPDCPSLLAGLLERGRRLMDNDVLKSLARTEQGSKLNPIQVIHYGYHIRERLKTQMQGLIEIYSRLDAWYSMALAVRKYHLSFPSFTNGEDPYMKVEALYH